MKKLLNTLFITNENGYLSLDGETVKITIDYQKVGQFPLHTLENIVCFSHPGASPALMGACASRGIGLSFYNPFGKFLCRINGENHGNVLLRKKQYRTSDDTTSSCLIARNMIIGKIFNSRWSIDRTLRDHPLRVNEEACKKAVQYLSNSLTKIKEEENLDSLRGTEGECASVYFRVFNELILNQKDDFIFRGRNKLLWIKLMLCFLSATRFWLMIVPMLWKESVLILISDLCIETAPDENLWHLI